MATRARSPHRPLHRQLLQIAWIAGLALLAPGQGPPCSVPAVSIDLGGGCGVSGTPQLVVPPPVIGGDLDIVLSTSHSFSALLLFWSFGPVASQPSFGPCVVHVDVIDPSNLGFGSFVTDVNGGFSWSLPIPNDPALVGGTVIFQCDVLHPGGPLPPGGSLSNGVLVQFGCPELGVIGDRAWLDLDDDGVQDPLEPGVPDVGVALTCGGVLVEETVTDANGFYLFSAAPAGECTVALLPTTFPIGVAVGSQCAPEPTIQLQPGQSRLDVDFCLTPCAECDGKVTELTLRYLGSAPQPAIMVEQQDGSFVVFNGIVEPGEIFAFSHHPSKNAFGSEVRIFVDGVQVEAIHTSCSRAIGPGLIQGDFEVLAGESRYGGALCVLRTCDFGKPCSLTLQYTGENCSATSHSQDPSKVSCWGDPSFASPVLIRSTDDSDPFKTDPKIWFEGSVSLGETFTLESLWEASNHLPSRVFIHVFGTTGNVLQSVEFQTSCSEPLHLGDQFGAHVIMGFGPEGTCEPPIGADLCAIFNRPRSLEMRYTGDGCIATSHSQDPNKVTCTGDPAFATSVTIRASDKPNPIDPGAKVWFTGSVSLDGTFLLDAANAGDNHLASETHIHIFDAASGALLQQVEFHTSCAQPLSITDQFGAARLEAFTPE